MVTEDFLRGAPWGNHFLVNVPDYDLNETKPVSGHLGQIDNQTLQNMESNWNVSFTYDNISNVDCLTRYSDLFGQHSNLMIVVDPFPGSENASLIEYHYNPTGLESFTDRKQQQTWICSDGETGGPRCDHRSDFKRTANHWYKHHHQITHCIAFNIEAGLGYGDCQMKFSPILMLGTFVISGLYL